MKSHLNTVINLQNSLQKSYYFLNSFKHCSAQSLELRVIPEDRKTNILNYRKTYILQVKMNGHRRKIWQFISEENKFY